MKNFDLSKLMEGRDPQTVMLEETRGLRSKWEKTGLLEGLEDKEQGSIAVLLENQAKQLLDEATQTGGQGSEEWSGVALPLVRRIFSEIASKEFISVQPMNLPSGLVFFLDFKYGTDRLGTPDYKGKSLFGGSEDEFGRTDEAKGGFYGEGRYGYTANQQVKSPISSADITGTAASWDEVAYSNMLSASVAAGNIYKLEIDKAEIDAYADDESIRSFMIFSGSSGDVNNYNQFHHVDDDKYVFFVEGTDGDEDVDVYYSLQPKDYNRGDFEDKDPLRGETAEEGVDKGTDLQIPEVDMELKSEPIVAKTRKLKAVWTPEMAQDLNAYHSIDAEAELTSMLSEYISLEIDLEILDMLKSNALTTEYWSATIGEEYDPVAKTWVNPGTAMAYQKNTWFQTLGTKLNKVSNKIHQLTLRGGANFVVASPDVCTILESIPAFSVNADKDGMQFAAGVSTVGSLANRYTVYKNPYMTSNEILMGFRGTNFLEAGAVYAPYVPLIMTPLVYDPQNFTPRRGIMTRYAKKMLRSEFYGRIFVKDLQQV